MPFTTAQIAEARQRITGTYHDSAGCDCTRCLDARILTAAFAALAGQTAASAADGGELLQHTVPSDAGGGDLYLGPRFSPARLQAVRTCIVHDNCSDGIAAAIILHDVLPDAEIRFMQYNTAEHEQLPATPGLLFCDFSPPPARIAEFGAVGTMVLDHHRTVKDAVLSLGPDGVYADEPGVSGATLAYRHVWEPLLGRVDGGFVKLRVQHLAQLIGLWDTWQTSAPEWPAARALHEVLKFYHWDYWRQPLYRHDWAALEQLGQHLVQRRDHQVRRMRDGAFVTTSTHGVKVLMVQGVTQISELSELVGSEADVVVGFLYLCEHGQSRLIFTCRSHTTVDVGALSTFHGGGGHARSAGFTLPLRAGDDPNPYQHFLACLDAYQERQ